MPARFVVKKGSTGKFRFSLHAENGEIVATSEAYNSRASALKGIAAVQRVAASATIDDQTATKKAAAAKTAAKKRAARS